MVKEKRINLRVSEELHKKIKELDINISETLRDYLTKKISNKISDRNNDIDKIITVLSTMKKQIERLQLGVEVLNDRIEKVTSY